VDQEINIEKPMHACIYLNKREFKTLQVGTTQVGPHPDKVNNINELMLLFPLSEIDLVIRVGRELAQEFKLRFEDEITPVRASLLRNPFLSDDTVIQRSVASSMSMLHELFKEVGDMGTAATAERLLDSDQQQAFEWLGKWVADNSLAIWRNKALVSQERDITIDIAALSKVATSYDISHLEGLDHDAVMQRRSHIANLFATNASRKNPDPRAVAATLMLRRLDSHDGYPAIRGRIPVASNDLSASYGR
jgi:hypothetical protein